MATAFVASSTTVGTGGSGTLTLPTWTVGTHDKVFIAVTSDTATDTISTPTGYSILLGPTLAATSQAPKLYVFVKDAVSGDSGASVTITRTGSGAWSSQARVYSGVGGIDASAIAGNGATATNNIPAPSLSPRYGGEQEIGFWAWYDSSGTGSATFTAPSGWSNRAGQSPIQSPYIEVEGWDSVNSGTTEASGTASSTNSTLNFSVGARIALAPTGVPFFVQEANNSVDASTTCVVTMPANVAAGDTVIVAVEYFDSPASVSISGLGATWTRIWQQTFSFGGPTEIWKGEGCTGGTAAITITATASTWFAAHAADFSGVGYVGTPGGGAQNTSSNPQSQTPPAVSLTPGDIAYAEFAWDNSVAAASYSADSPGAWSTLTRVAQATKGVSLQTGYRVGATSESASRRCTVASSVTMEYAALLLAATQPVLPKARSGSVVGQAVARASVW